MSTPKRSRILSAAARLALAVSVAVVFATLHPSIAADSAPVVLAQVPRSTPSPAPAFGADLGVPSGLTIASDSATCGQYMTTEALDAQCDTALANHWIILGWHFNPNGCLKPPCHQPDGFNVVRVLNGSASVFATQSAEGASNTFGTFLHVRGDENIGTCFYVLPYRGTNDYGSRSGQVCILEIMHLPVRRWGTAHSYYAQSGLDCSSPSSNPIGYFMMFDGGANAGNELFAGYVSRSEPGCDNMYWDVYQGLIYFDLSKLAGKSVSKATLQLEVVKAAYNGGDPTGNTNGVESGASPLNCVTSIGFPINVNVDSAPIPYPPLVSFASFTTLNGGIGKISVDVTNMVRAWLNPGGINRGIVLSPPYLNATSSERWEKDNAECLSQFREPTLDVELH